MNNCKIKCIDCLFRSDVASALKKEELKSLSENCYTIQYKKGELIVKEGTQVQNIIYLRNGYVKCIKSGDNGKDFVLNIKNEGSYIGIQNTARKQETNFYSAIAISEIEVCHIEINCFYELIKKNGLFAIEVISTIINEENYYLERFTNNIQKQLPGRLASILIYFKEQIYFNNNFDINLTRSELSSLIGASREGVSRILNEFKKSKILDINGSRISILDENRLKEIKYKG